MSFIIRNKTGTAVVLNDLGLTIPAGIGSPLAFDVDLSIEQPNDIANSADLVAAIVATTIVVLDPLDGVSELTALQSQEVVEVHNEPHYRIRGGDLNQLDDVNTTGAILLDVLQLGAGGIYIPASPDDIVGGATGTVNQQIVDLFQNGSDTTFTVTGSPPTAVQIDVNDVFLRNTGDTLDSGTLTIATGASINIATGGDLTITDAPVNPTDAVNKTYVDSVAAGLDPKESVRGSTTADIAGIYAAGGGTGGTGAFTAVDLTSDVIFDGVPSVAAYQVGDRILIKDQTDPKQNGLYVVTTAGAVGAIERASDQDGSPANEVSAGNFTFVEQGTTLANTGWVLTGDGILTLNTDDIIWTQFSESSSFSAGAGLALTGTVFSLDINNMTAATIALGDEIAFNDVSGPDVPRNTTVQNMLNDLNIPYGLTGTGLVVQTADDTYVKRAVAVNGPGAVAGLSIVNGDGVLGNPTVGLDIQSLPYVISGSPLGTISTVDRVPVYDVDAGVNVYYTISDISGALATVNSFETWAGGGNTSGDATIVAESATDTVTISGGTGINVGLTAATDTMVLDLSFAAIPAGGSPNVVDPTDEIILNNGGTIVKVTMQEMIDGLGLGAFDVCTLTPGSTVTLDVTDEIAVCDGGSTVKFSFSDIFETLDVVSGVTGTGMIVKTGGSPDSYATRSIAVAGVGLGDGLAVTNGGGIAGNPTLELDIDGTPAAGEDMAATDEFVGNNASAVANEKFTGAEIAQGVLAISGLSGLTVGIIGGSGSPGEEALFLTDASRTKDLSMAEWNIVFSENNIRNNDWIQVGNSNDANAGYIVPMNATIVRITGVTTSGSGNIKPIDLYINGVQTASYAAFAATTGEDSFADFGKNTNVTAGDKIRLRGGSTGGTVQDTIITLWLKWRK